MSNPASDKAALIKCLEEGGGEALGLTLKKFIERGRIIDPAVPRGIVRFEVERHRAIGGAHYTPGLPMSAFETYRARYEFDPKTNSLSEIPEEEERVNLDIDAAGHSSFEFRYLWMSWSGMRGAWTE